MIISRMWGQVAYTPLKLTACSPSPLHWFGTHCCLNHSEAPPRPTAVQRHQSRRDRSSECITAKRKGFLAEEANEIPLFSDLEIPIHRCIVVKALREPLQLMREKSERRLPPLYPDCRVLCRSNASRP